jgi:poly(A) polymerase
VPESGPGGDPALDAPLLAQALVALNRQGELLATLGSCSDRRDQLYLVGGSVRDALLGRRARTSTSPPMRGRTWCSGSCGPGPTRCGTPASNSARSARPGTAGASRSRPSGPILRSGVPQPEVRFGDRLEDDLVRRDFTVNAMAVRITAEGLANSSIRWAGSRHCATVCSIHPGGAGGVLR